MIAIIDYDAGNIKSVEKAVQQLGKDAVITRDKELLSNAEKLILPGVGAFGDAMERLNAYGLSDMIRSAAGKGTPLLGICLGLQLFFEESEESPGVQGLSLLKGKIKRFPEKDGLKIPQIGWNSLDFPKKSRLLAGLNENPYVYFVHSYYLDAADKACVAATADYGLTFDAAVEHDNIFACQFHPEKSSDTGLKILRNFLEI